MLDIPGRWEEEAATRPRVGSKRCYSESLTSPSALRGLRWTQSLPEES